MTRPIRTVDHGAMWDCVAWYQPSLAKPPLRGHWSECGVVARKRDLKQIDAICSRYRHLLKGDKEYDFRMYLHDCKESGDRGSQGGDFTQSELYEKLREFLGVEELP